MHGAACIGAPRLGGDRGARPVCDGCPLNFCRRFAGLKHSRGGSAPHALTVRCSGSASASMVPAPDPPAAALTITDQFSPSPPLMSVQVAGAGWLASAASHAINVQVSSRVSSAGRGVRAERRFGRPRRVGWLACTPIMPSRGWMVGCWLTGVPAVQERGRQVAAPGVQTVTVAHSTMLHTPLAEQRGAARLWHRLRRGLRPAGRPVPVSRCCHLCMIRQTAGLPARQDGSWLVCMPHAGSQQHATGRCSAPQVVPCAGPWLAAAACGRCAPCPPPAAQH